MASNNAISDEILKTEERIRQLSASAVGLSPRDTYSMFNDVDKGQGSDVDNWAGDTSVRQKQVRYDNTVGSNMEARGPSASSDLIYDVTPELMVFLNFLDQQKVSKQAKELLLSEGVDSKETLGSLLAKDVEGFILPLGQKRLIQRLVNELGAGRSVATGTERSDVHNSGGDAGRAVLDGPPIQEGPSGGLNTDMFLGFGIHGTQSPYHDIVDFLPKRSPYDPSDESNTVIVQKEGGLLAVEPNLSREKSLEKVSWQQWLEASMQIMFVLMNEGVEPRHYMLYTVIIAQLAGRYDWVSVLKYDREYRKKQANSGKQWGSDMPILRDVTLIPKQTSLYKGIPRPDSTQTQGKSKKGSGKDQAGGQKRVAKKKGPSNTGAFDKYKVCRLFNEGSCPFGASCKFKHICNSCHETTHGESQHPN